MAIIEYACVVQMAVDCVILPENIDITMQDIGGLDGMVEQLVSPALLIIVSCVSRMQNVGLSCFELQTWLCNALSSDTCA